MNPVRPLCLLLAMAVPAFGAERAELSPELQADLATLVASSRLESRNIGFSGEPSRLYRAAEHLIRNAPSVFPFFEHENPLVRAYAIELAGPLLSAPDLYRVLLREIATGDAVNTFSADISDREFLADLCFYLVEEHLTGAQKTELLDRLLRSGTKFRMTSRALRDWPLPAHLRPLVRERASTDESCLHAVASWREETDLGLILSWRHRFEAFWDAADQFPHASFAPLLEDDFGKHADNLSGARGAVFFSAVLKQTRAGHTNLLSRIPACLTDDFRSYQIANSLASALYAIEGPEFADLDFLLWEKHNLLSLPRWRVLMKTAPEQTRRLNLASLGKLGELRSPFPDDMNHKVHTAILDEVVLDQPPGFAEAIAAFLRSLDCETAGFLPHIAPLMNPERAAILLEHLKSDTNPNAYLPCAKLLLAYDPSGGAEAIRSAIETHPHLREGWGGDALTELLKSADAAALPAATPSRR